MDVSVNGPQKLNDVRSKWVWFEGATALKEGQGVCYNYDYGTAASADGRRTNRVELPSITNAQYFAGVAARDYSAHATGQLIEIYVPGSTCNILSKASNTLGSGRTTCIAGGTYAGYFQYAGFEGKGSAKPLQTIDRSSTAGLCLAELEDGPQSGLIEVYIAAGSTPTLTPAGGAETFMVGGVTIFEAPITLAANSTFTLADSTIPGLKKGFKCMATMTTSDVVITVTSGLQGMGNASPLVALATITLDADDEECFLYWGGSEANGQWYAYHVLGSVLA
jgi:hypothetical protein